MFQRVSADFLRRPTKHLFIRDFTNFGQSVEETGDDVEERVTVNSGRDDEQNGNIDHGEELNENVRAKIVAIVPKGTGSETSR